MMTYSKPALAMTESFESCRLTSYIDEDNVLTIGYGHTGAVLPRETCTVAEAEAWLMEDLAFAETEVNRLVKVPLSQGEFDALVDFTFNCGCHAFDHSTMLKRVNAGDMELAACEFDKWDRCGGKVVAGLLRRRQAETAEFEAK
jgi:lysozyme